jgi:hypothetical protein
MGRSTRDDGEVDGQSEAGTAGVWRGLVVGSLASLTGFWAPLGLALWWLTR